MRGIAKPRRSPSTSTRSGPPNEPIVPRSARIEVPPTRPFSSSRAGLAAGSVEAPSTWAEPLHVEGKRRSDALIDDAGASVLDDETRDVTGTVPGTVPARPRTCPRPVMAARASSARADARRQQSDSGAARPPGPARSAPTAAASRARGRSPAAASRRRRRRRGALTRMTVRSPSRTSTFETAAPPRTVALFAAMTGARRRDRGPARPATARAPAHRAGTARSRPLCSHAESAEMGSMPTRPAICTCPPAAGGPPHAERPPDGPAAPSLWPRSRRNRARPRAHRLVPPGHPPVLHDDLADRRRPVGGRWRRCLAGVGADGATLGQTPVSRGADAADRGGTKRRPQRKFARVVSLDRRAWATHHEPLDRAPARPVHLESAASTRSAPISSRRPSPMPSRLTATEPCMRFGTPGRQRLVDAQIRLAMPVSARA